MLPTQSLPPRGFMGGESVTIALAQRNLTGGVIVALRRRPFAFPIRPPTYD